MWSKRSIIRITWFEERSPLDIKLQPDMFRLMQNYHYFTYWLWPCAIIVRFIFKSMYVDCTFAHAIVSFLCLDGWDYIFSYAIIIEMDRIYLIWCFILALLATRVDAFVPKGALNNKPALIQIMAYNRSGDKPLYLDPLRAKFLRKNINIYLHFMSFLHTNKT